MGRHKTYDREQVLQKAMRLFWMQGFHGTSTRDLAEAMGVNAYSLYAEFESKEALYEAALQRYDDTVVTRHFGVLEAPGAGLDAVRQVVRFFGGAARDNNPKLGCLMCNAITEHAPTEATSARTGATYVHRLTRAFEHALSNARERGELVPESPVAELANFLAVALIGVFVMLRAGVDPHVMHDTAEQTLARVEGFVTPAALPRATRP